MFLRRASCASSTAVQGAGRLLFGRASNRTRVSLVLCTALWREILARVKRPSERVYFNKGLHKLVGERALYIDVRLSSFNEHPDAQNQLVSFVGVL